MQEPEQSGVAPTVVIGTRGNPSVHHPGLVTGEVGMIGRSNPI